MNETYACLFCGRVLEADDDGIFIHDNVPHPPEFKFDEEDNPQ